MPRTIRKTSSSNIYHIILRGINKRTIFECDEDYRSFIHSLIFYKTECKYQILAYCLMNNHIHLLLRFDDLGDDLSLSMKKIEDKFVWWYNTKYERIGPLFQNRFISEPVDDENYLIQVFRYIHQNPVKAHIVDNLSQYKWSSFFAYQKNCSDYVDINFLKGYFSNSDELLNYLSLYNNDYCMEYLSFRSSDDYAVSVLKDILGCDNLSEIDSLPLDTRENFFARLFSIGMSVSQISRITGFSKPLISRSIKHANK